MTNVNEEFRAKVEEAYLAKYPWKAPGVAIGTITYGDMYDEVQGSLRTEIDHRTIEELPRQRITINSIFSY
ncbi:hypothetical protein HYT25_02010 [Candidatus Pacearchaeota archaeon]|nr:hypothetical protein [Candidatus Pacearchaeota archaeon]